MHSSKHLEPVAMIVSFQGGISLPAPLTRHFGTTASWPLSAITITRNNHDAASFWRTEAASWNADAARRMLALALKLDGVSQADATRACGVNRQTLRDWVYR